MEKCFEDLRQDEKHVPDLLESIMRPTYPVKEELWPNLFKTIQFDPNDQNYVKKSRKSRFQLFGFRKSKVFAPQANASLLTSKF